MLSTQALLIGVRKPLSSAFASVALPAPPSAVTKGSVLPPVTSRIAERQLLTLRAWRSSRRGIGRPVDVLALAG